MALETKNILYLPGLGDQNTTERQRKYLSWKSKRHGVSLTFFDPKWSSDESYSKKWNRLQDLLKTCDLKQTTAVGVSAGGSLLMRVLADYPDLLNAHSVCGKLQNSIGIGPDFKKRAPALYDSVVASEKALESTDIFAHKLTTFLPIFDGVVLLSDMVVLGARKKRIPLIGHLLSIAYYLALKLPIK